MRKTKTVESLAQQILFPKPIECAATRYGTNNEKHALEEYQILKNCSVIRLGVIVSKEQPWLYYCRWSCCAGRMCENVSGSEMPNIL